MAFHAFTLAFYLSPEPPPMTTATMPDRLRQIAILISSVDATAARQILLQLPTDTARHIRQLTARLGEVSAEEKRRILADFQRSAASAGSSAGLSALRTGHLSHANPSSHSAHSSGAAAAGGSAALTTGRTRADAMAGGAAEPGSTAVNEQLASDESASRAAWTRLSTAALVRFVREERAPVTAVVISQLEPAVAVEVLQHLPAATRREVLLRLSHLQQIDPEAMKTIDEHLSQRLHEYQHQIQSELQNSRRIKSLLAAAPPEVRSDWAELLGDTASQPTSPAAKEQASQGQAAGAQPHWPQAVPMDRGDVAERTQPSAAGDDGDILPFRRESEDTAKPTGTAAERLLIQWEFEQILQLPATALAHLLSSTDSQTVLLALAGASPEFMKQFYGMLNRHDAKALEARLQRIGSIQLRDVDAAQRTIVDNAAGLRGVLAAGKAGRQAA